MITKNIKVHSIKDICDMIQMAQAVKGDVTIYKGHYVVDGKSAMGVFSIDISDGAKIEYPNDELEFDDYLKQFEG